MQQSNMRVLHFYKTYYPDSVGGVEQVINQLARSSQPFGVQTDVLSLSKNPNPSTMEWDGHQVHRVKTSFEFASTPFSIAALKRFKSLAKEVDVIHYHYPWPFMDIMHFMTQINKPTVLTYHSDIVRQQRLFKLYHPLSHRFLLGVDRIVATSPNYLASSPVLEGFRDKTEVIPIGLDRATYPMASVQCLEKWRARFSQPFFLFIGVLRYYKGLHVLIEAMREVDYPLVLVGTGPMEAMLKKQAEKVGLNNIHFLGKVSDEDKLALLSLCYALVFPSHLRSEAFGISLLEGAMYGKPLISSEIGTGTSFINVDGETGLVVQPDDPKALCEAMNILWNKPDMAKTMGNNAEMRYWKYFTAEQMAKAYIKLYKTLLN